MFNGFWNYISNGDQYQFRNCTGDINGFKWSDELGASASNFVESLSGCNTYVPNLKELENESDFLRTIAKFADHR